MDDEPLRSYLRDPPPGSALERAIAAGVDVTATLHAMFALTPEERLVRAGRMISDAQRIATERDMEQWRQRKMSGEIDPVVTILDDYGPRIQYESRIKFRPAAGGEVLLRRLLANGQMQVIWESSPAASVTGPSGSWGQRLVCWPLDDTTALLQITDTCSQGDAPPGVFLHHTMSVEAQIRVLEMLNGYSERVRPEEFPNTEPPASAPN